ncbi:MULTISPECIES: cyclase family protein [Bacillus]|uniref:Cyclase n=2 Tax=Bacillus TaxID=1386 RepID=A0A0M4FUA6_9BACI|nr:MULTISPECIES: cyclase family protein [Bacillus]ALC83434.1 cyclase [Bacillus gobiensis]MBP1082375.1 kynurenine formamidase [Bacillus capparidis]MED1097366.1 cyclase family protein [Bacillus capparidis]
MNIRQIVDLSVPLKAGIPSDPPGALPKIDYFDHKQGAEQLIESFPGLSSNDLPGNEGWAVEKVNMTTHAGTHIDAPYHYRSVSDDGKPMLTIDEVPLDWFHGPGVKLDFRHFEDGHVISAKEIREELSRINHKLIPGDIVLVNTSAGAKYGEKDFLESGCGMGREATLYLTEHGVRLVGTDAWSWDAPFNHTAKRYENKKDPSIIWEGHFAGSKIPYCQIEKLANLEQLPATGFYVFAFPVKIDKASAGWARPVAVQFF